MSKAANYRRNKALERIETAAQVIVRKLPIQPPYIQYEGPDQAVVEAQQFEALADFLDVIAVVVPVQSIIDLPPTDLPGMLGSEEADDAAHG